MWAYAHEVGRLAIAATLLVAGASKLVSPRPLARSLGQTFGLPLRVGVAAGRTVAVVEVGAALLVAAYWLPAVGLVLTGLVGAGIAAFAATAMARGATEPCGCFGETNGRPVGVRNLLAGAALLAGGLGLLVLPGSASAPAELFLPLTAALALLTVMVRDRSRLLSPFLRHFRPAPVGPVPEGSEGS